MAKTEIEIQVWPHGIVLALSNQATGFKRGADKQAIVLDRQTATALRDQLNEALAIT